MGLDNASIKYLKLIKEKYDVDFDRTAMLGRLNLVVPDEDM